MKNFIPYRYLMIFLRVPVARIPILKNLFFKAIWFIVFGIFFFPLIAIYLISEFASLVLSTWSEKASIVTGYLEAKAKSEVDKLHEKISPEELCKMANIPFRETPEFVYKGFDDDEDSNNL